MTRMTGTSSMLSSRPCSQKISRGSGEFVPAQMYKSERRGQSKAEPAAAAACSIRGVSETAMHWRKVPGKANGKVFYGVVLALTALIAVSTALLVLHFHA